MSGRLERAVAFFVAPPSAVAPTEASSLPPAVRAAVLGSADEVLALAAAVALTLRAADRSPAALVAVWPGGGTPAGGFATRAGARLAERLEARGLSAVARGRLAWLPLPDEPCEAADAVRRASAVVDGPLVTALAAARPPDLETLTAEHDLAIVAADPSTPLARAALASLAAHGIQATAHPPLRRGLGRTLAVAGIAAARFPTPSIATEET